MATTQLNLKLNNEVKAQAEEEFVIPEQYESMTLDDDLFDHFMRVCNEMQSPNQALMDAAAFANVYTDADGGGIVLAALG